jgi:hypothetical protein
MVAEAEMPSFAAVGQGTDVRLSAAQVTGGAVFDGGRVVHLNAFRREAEQDGQVNPGGRRAEEDKAPGESWIARARRRLSGR